MWNDLVKESLTRYVITHTEDRPSPTDEVPNNSNNISNLAYMSPVLSQIKKKIYIMYNISMVVKSQNVVFWIMTPSDPVGYYQCFGGTT